MRTETGRTCRALATADLRGGDFCWVVGRLAALEGLERRCISLLSPTGKYGSSQLLKTLSFVSDLLLVKLA